MTVTEDSVLIVLNSIPDRTVLPMNDHIGLLPPGDGFCLSDSGFLFSVLGGNSFIALPSHGPTVFIRYYMLMPGSGPGTLTGTFKNGLNYFKKFTKKRFGFRHGDLGYWPKILFFWAPPL